MIKALFGSIVIALSLSSAALQEDRSIEGAVAQLKAFAQEEAAADRFSGTVLLARDGEVLFEGAYGLASKRFKIPNKIDTKFNLGSMNKMFTCVSIMQLVQSGKLALDDPIVKYVDESWLPAELAEKIELQHLMTHTSGLGNYFNRSFMESSRLMFRELDDYKPIVYQDTLAFDPGSSWGYSNSGMFLLGVIIEKVSGKRYFDYVLENVHGPAGMKNTDCFEMDRPVENLAIGYSLRDGEWYNNIYQHVVKGGPAGGGFSTVADLMAFDTAMRELVLLDQDATELLWSAKPELGSRSYGFGFSIGGTPDNRIVGHSGGFPGINSNLDMYLDSGYTAAVMSNYDGGASLINNKIQRLLARVVD